mgnify:CR=1 FL=1
MKTIIKAIIRISLIAVFCVLAMKSEKEVNWLWAYIYLVSATVVLPAIVNPIVPNKKSSDGYDGTLEIVDAGEEGTTYLMHVDMNQNFEDRDELRIKVEK